MELTHRIHYKGVSVNGCKKKFAHFFIQCIPSKRASYRFHTPTFHPPYGVIEHSINQSKSMKYFEALIFDAPPLPLQSNFNSSSCFNFCLHHSFIPPGVQGISESTRRRNQNHSFSSLYSSTQYMTVINLVHYLSTCCQRLCVALTPCVSKKTAQYQESEMTMVCTQPTLSIFSYSILIFPFQNQTGSEDFYKTFPA